MTHLRNAKRRCMVMVSLFALILSSVALTDSPAGATTSPTTPVLRALLNLAIIPADAKLVHPSKPVVCRCSVSPADTRYLVTMHRFFVVPGSPTSVEAFIAAHVPKGGVEGGEAFSGALLTNSTNFPANGPHIYLRELGYTIAAKNSSSTWLRIDSAILWVPSRTASQVVPSAVSATATGYKSVNLDGSVGPTTHDVSGRQLSDLLGVINSLPLGPQNDCVEDPIGFTLKMTLKDYGTVEVDSGFCGGPSDRVMITQLGNTNETQFSLSDTSCTLIKEVVSLFVRAPVQGTRDMLQNCESWVKHPVS
jgi:hypothetical protein